MGSCIMESLNALNGYGLKRTRKQPNSTNSSNPAGSHAATACSWYNLVLRSLLILLHRSLLTTLIRGLIHWDRAPQTLLRFNVRGGKFANTKITLIRVSGEVVL